MKSRTIRLMLLIEALTAITGGIHLLQPFMSEQTFAYISFFVAVTTPMLAIYMRTITTTPLNENDSK